MQKNLFQGKGVSAHLQRTSTGNMLRQKEQRRRRPRRTLKSKQKQRIPKFLKYIEVTASMGSMWDLLSWRNGMEFRIPLNWPKMIMMIWVLWWKSTGNTNPRIWIASCLFSLEGLSLLLLKMMLWYFMKFIRSPFESFRSSSDATSGLEKSTLSKWSFSKGIFRFSCSTKFEMLSFSNKMGWLNVRLLKW